MAPLAGLLAPKVSRVPSVHSRFQRTLPASAGVLALLSVGALMICDASPAHFPANVHDTLATLPLVLAATALVLLQAVRRARLAEWAKATILAVAFLFWGASQIWVDRTIAMLLNDSAVALFVLDVVLAVFGWPSDTIPETPS
jgi:hypothetical protein